MKTTNVNRGLATLLLLLVVAGTAGCFDEIIEPEYNGPPQVQFDPTSGAVLDGSGTLTMNIQLVAPHQDSDTNFPVSVVEDATNLSGYELLTETATIPAGSSFGEVSLDVGASDIPPGEQRQITLALNDSENGEITPAENFRTFTLTVFGETANVAVEPTSVGFGEVPVGTTETDTIEVSNVADGFDGTLSTQLSDFEVSGDDADAFEVTVMSPENNILDTGDTAEVLVTFSPSAEGDYEAELTFSYDNDPNASSATIGLTGTGTAGDGVVVEL